MADDREPPLYPVMLRVDGARCLVVGGGPIAARKTAGLLECGAEVTVVAPEIAPAFDDLDVHREVRRYVRGEVAGYRLAVTATDDPEVNHHVFVDGEAAGVLVNSADDPDNCAFFLPARVRRGPLTVAVSTSGRSPALAAWLRRRLGEQLGPEYEDLAALLRERRDAIRASGRSSEGLGWQRALDSGMLDLLREGRREDARDLLRSIVDPDESS